MTPDGRRSRRTALVLGAMAAVYFATRLPGLLSLPIFCDEAVHLRWAELVRESPFTNAFVSMQNPKPPLHIWLLALTWPWGGGPLESGRLLSVVVGVATIPLVWYATRRFARAFLPSEQLGTAGAAAALLALASPFAAFYQRMTLAESLFLVESLLAATLALRLAESGRGSAGAAFGLAMGAAMWTRQDLSYLLWALPVLWYVLLRPRPPLARFARGYLVAGAVAAVLWTPLLVQKTGPDWKTRVFYDGGYREPLALARRLSNAADVASWLATYLTIPVALLAVVGLAWLFLSGGRRAALALALSIWFLVIALPLVAFGSILFPRHFLTVVPPLWIAAGLLVAGLQDALRRRVPSPGGALAGVLLALIIGAALVPSALALRLQATDPLRQTLVPVDRFQYVSGWPAGGATQQAIDFVLRRAAAAPSIVLTPEIAGNPTDSVWLELRGRPGIELAFLHDSQRGPLRPPDSVRDGGWLAREDLRRGGAERSMRRDARPVYLVAPDPFLTLAGWRPAREVFGEREAGITAVARFENAASENTPLAAVVVFELQRDPGGGRGTSSPE